MNFDAFVHMLKDYSVFRFVPKLSYALDSELHGLFRCCCFPGYMKMAISKSVIE